MAIEFIIIQNIQFESIFWVTINVVTTEAHVVKESKYGYTASVFWREKPEMIVKIIIINITIIWFWYDHEIT